MEVVELDHHIETGTFWCCQVSGNGSAGNAVKMLPWQCYVRAYAHPFLNRWYFMDRHVYLYSQTWWWCKTHSDCAERMRVEESCFSDFGSGVSW